MKEVREALPCTEAVILRPSNTSQEMVVVSHGNDIASSALVATVFTGPSRSLFPSLHLTLAFLHHRCKPVVYCL